MILAAGLGTRMRPLTLDRAKPVLPVLDRPLLHWTLEMLAGHGVKDVMINLHYLPRTVRAAVGDGRAFGLRVSYSFEREILGTGGGPRKVRRWIGDETLLILNGDVVFDFDLTARRRRHERAGAPATLALIPNPDPRHYSAVRSKSKTTSPLRRSKVSSPIQWRTLRGPPAVPRMSRSNEYDTFKPKARPSPTAARTLRGR